MTSTLLRWTLVGGLVVAGLAAAQPANNSCANSEVLSVTQPNIVVRSRPATIGGTTWAHPQPFSCQSNSQYPVWFSLTPTLSGTYRIETCAASAPQNSVGDTVLAVYTGTCSGLTQVTGGCSDDFCSFQSSVSLTLTAGTTYYIQAARYGTGTTSATLQVSVVNVTVPVNDRCDGTVPSLQLGAPLLFGTSSLTVDDARLADNACYAGVGHGTLVSTNQAPGRDVVFSFTPPTTGAYSVRLGAPSASVNGIVYLTDSCQTAMTPPHVYSGPQCLGAANRSTASTTANEEVSCVTLQQGVPTYVWVDEGSSSTSGATWEVEVSACVREVEPNGTPAEAGPLACPVTLSVNPAADVDFFSLGSPPAGARVYAMIDGIAANSTDSQLRVTTATDTLEFDEDDGDALFGSLASNIAGTPLLGGPAYLRVNHWSASTIAEPYRLFSVVQTGTPVAEVEPNDNVTQANASPANYFAGTVATTSEVDFYAFDAVAGQVVFLALDSQPSRSGSTATGDHTLQLWNSAGTTLVAVNDGATTVNNTLTSGSLTATSPNVPSEALWYRIRQTGTYFARVGRASSTGTGDYVLSISLDCGAGGGIGVPSLASITPSSGTTSGAATVTLDGVNFAPNARVLFGANTATVTSSTPTRLIVQTPPGNEGVVDVTVVNFGQAPSTLPNAFTYVAPVVPPTVTAVNPASASTLGGAVITLSGTNFKVGAEVRFDVGGDVRQGTDVAVVSPVQLRVTTPAHVAGTADITVRNPADDMSGTLAGLFTFIAPPVLSGITPNQGLTSGGLTVTLSGTGFRTGATVRFGGTLGTGVVVAGDGLSLTVVTPSRATDGSVDVSVTNTDGQVSTLAGAFTYRFPAPTLAAVTPAQGFLDGGLTITLTGTNFLAPLTLPDGGISGPAVTLGSAPATSVTRNSATQVTAVTPAGAAGVVDVTFTNSDGQSVTRPQAFRYVAPPELLSISPTRGPVLGGTRITLTGSNFLPGAVVRVGGVPAFGVSVTDTEITAVTSAARAGLADVSVTNPDTQTSTLTEAFTYDPAPTLAEVSPIVGSTAGGTLITVTGTSFRAGATVLFGSDPGTGVTVASETLLTVTSPPHAAGVVTVTVRNDDGQGSSLARAYRYVDPPTVASAAPSSGDVAGGTVVRLTGTGFGAQMSVTFGGVASTSVTYVSPTTLDALTPPHGPGAVDVIVTTNTGVSATLTGGFTYTRQAPTVSAIAPAGGPTAGGTLVSITGTGFAEGATVSFDGAAATGVELASPSLLRAVAPAHAAGAVDVVVTNDDGQAATLAGAYTYRAPPDGTTGLVTDGGDGALTSPEMDAGTGGGTGTGGGGCGCASVDGSLLAGLGLGLLALARRRRR